MQPSLLNSRPAILQLLIYSPNCFISNQADEEYLPPDRLHQGYPILLFYFFSLNMRTGHMQSGRTEILAVTLPCFDFTPMLVQQ